MRKNHTTRTTVDRTTGWLLTAATVLLALLCACPGAWAQAEQTAQPKPVTLGMHLHTVHFGGHHLNDSNPGLYLHARSGLLAGASVGVYRNSYRDTSAYAAYTWETTTRLAAVTVGGVTGYRSARIAPLLVPSLRLPLPWPDAGLRLSYLPRAVKHGAAGLHISLETDL
jgi:hypothetical protein